MKNSTVLKTGFLLLSYALAAHSQPDRSHLAALPAEVIQATYLTCDRRAAHEMLGFADAASCSEVAEELKHRVFGGDFDKLLQWWREHKSPAPTHSTDSENVQPPLK